MQVLFLSSSPFDHLSLGCGKGGKIRAISTTHCAIEASSSKAGGAFEIPSRKNTQQSSMRYRPIKETRNYEGYFSRLKCGKMECNHSFSQIFIICRRQLELQWLLWSNLGGESSVTDCQNWNHAMNGVWFPSSRRALEQLNWANNSRLQLFCHSLITFLKKHPCDQKSVFNAAKLASKQNRSRLALPNLSLLACPLFISLWEHLANLVCAKWAFKPICRLLSPNSLAHSIQVRIVPSSQCHCCGERIWQVEKGASKINLTI